MEEGEEKKVGVDGGGGIEKEVGEGFTSFQVYRESTEKKVVTE